MKIINLVLLSIFFIGCNKEVIPSGLILKDVIQNTDTIYFLPSIPVAQQKCVFVEEFTGVRCVNCPYAAAAIKNMQIANPNRIFVAKLHYSSLAIPVNINDFDLRCTSSLDLSTYLGASSMPGAAIDRVLNTTNSNYAFSFGFWNNLVNVQLGKTTPVNLNLEVISYNATSKEVKLQTKATFTNNFADSVTYHIYVLENGIEATQDSSGGVELEEYEHEEVLRDVVTPIGSGAPWLNNISPKPAGLEAIKISTFNLPSNIVNAAKCVVLVAIQNARTKEMIQVNEVKLQ